MSGRFAGERAVVVGAGVAGAAAARVLVDEGAHGRVTEARPAAELGTASSDLRELGVDAARRRAPSPRISTMRRWS